MQHINPGSVIPYGGTRLPLSNITPFTYRDGATYAEILERMRKYIQDDLVPNIDGINIDVANNLNALLNEYETQLSNTEKSWATNFDAFMGDVVNRLEKLNDESAGNLVLQDTSFLWKALLQKITPRANRAVNVKDYGAVGDGVTDDTAAINYAAQVAFNSQQNQELYIPAGIYKITDTVTVKTGIFASEAELRYFGSGVALQIGSGDAGVNYSRKTVRLPRVTNWTYGYLGGTFDATSRGVVIYNAISCDIYVPFIQYFNTGLTLAGYGAGFGYNTIYLQSLWSNRTNLLTERVNEAGWVNQNTFVGGRISPPNWLRNDTIGSMIELHGNMNVFINTSLEGTDEYKHRVKFLAARYNTFYSPRFESPGDATKHPTILWGDGSYYNKIDGGYNSLNLVETFEGSQRANAVSWREGPREFRANASTSATIAPGSTATVIKSWSQYNGFSYSYDPETGVWTPRQGRWQINAKIGISFPGAGGYVQVSIVKSTGAILNIARAEISGTNVITIPIDVRETFDNGQGFTIQVSHTNAGNGSLIPTSNFNKLQAEYLGL